RLVALSTDVGRGADVVAHGDPGVVLLALFAKDPDGARGWAARVLGRLAGPGEQNATLRATLAAYFANGENVMRTADALGAHRNTVRHRV
ncbi:helix-turn-helix domain-containing protein, partial [Streptomyces scabiei]|uniref:helix-turn-helix domain-containing protein n=1 Tax=Streptomyces scabiei TaxID=1930 RepID=UPI0038F69302